MLCLSPPPNYNLDRVPHLLVHSVMSFPFIILSAVVETADVYNIGTEQPRPKELLLPHPAVDDCRG